MKKAIVTGATGYIGSNLCKKLLEEGWQVFALVRKNYNPEYIKDIKSQIGLLYLSNQENLNKFFLSIEPDVVFHLAASTNNNDVSNLIDSNIKLGTQILEAMKIAGTECIINTGTYWQHYNSEEYNPLDLYSASKQAFQDILKFYTSSNNTNAITLKLFDTYGPGDKRPKVINLMLTSTEIIDMSPGEQELNFVHIDDIVNAYIKAYEYMKSKETIGNYEEFAVASPEIITLKELGKLIGEIKKSPVKVNWGGKPYKSREMMLLWKEYKTLPNWVCNIKLKKGLENLIK